MTSKVIQEAMAKSRALIPTNDLAEIEVQIRKIDNRLSGLYGIEAEARDILNTKRSQLDRTRTMLTAKGGKYSKYIPISLDCLRWRDSRGLPLLTLFKLDGPYFKAEAIHRDEDQESFYCTWDSYPSALRACYNDVVQLVKTKAKKRSKSFFFDIRATATLEARFSGVIPDSTRAKIKEAEAVFVRDNMYLLGDPPVTLTVNRERLAMKAILPDPIVVGWDGTSLWAIDEFDMSPIEEAALLA